MSTSSSSSTDDDDGDSPQIRSRRIIGGSSSSSSAMTHEDELVRARMIQRISTAQHTGRAKCMKVVRVSKLGERETLVVFHVWLTSESPPVQLIVRHVIAAGDEAVFHVECRGCGGEMELTFGETMEAFAASSECRSMSALIAHAIDIVHQMRTIELVSSMELIDSLSPLGEENDTPSPVHSISSGTTAASRQSSRSTTPTISSSRIE